MLSDFYKNKKVLITGDTGFKGSWMSLWLSNLGAEIFGYSLLPKKESNFNSCKMDNIINQIKGDVRDLDFLKEQINKIKPDIAFHFAAQSIVLDSINDPYETYSTNVMGTVNFFEALKSSPNTKVGINVTSDKCYKNKNWIWGYRENDELGGKDPYSASKSASEIVTSSYLSTFFSINGTANIASVRAGNVIGAGDWSNYRIVPDLFRSIKNDKKLIIRNPHSTRPWQHVLDPLYGYMILAERLYNDGKKFQGSWNFGPLNNSNKTVIELIEEFNSYEKKFDYVIEEDNAKIEAKLLNLDISKAMNHLNWSPLLNFKETVRLTAEGYLNDINNKLSIENRLNAINFYYKILKQKKDL